jgi:glycosyltransferase involved in cell wall biosynthesis
MKFSVIIPAYKRAKALKNCLDALLAQSMLPYEIIVVCRESDIDVNKTVDSFDSPIIKKHNVGEISKITVLENIGVSKATGDILVFCDDDTVSFPDWIKTFSEIFKDEKVGTAGGPSIYPEEGGEIFSEKKSIVKYWGAISDGHENTPPEAYECHHYAACNMAIRKSAWRKFDETLLGYHYRFELDICMDIKRRGYKLIFDPSLKQHHFPGRAKSRKGFRTLKEIHDTHANNTYVVLKNASVFRKLLFILFTFIWGDDGCPGFVRYILQGLKNRSPYRFAAAFVSLVGKIRGIFMWIRFLLS